MEYIKRSIEKKIQKWFKNYPVVVLTGARQVGKSTLIENLFKDKIKTIVFDPVQDIGNARQDPDFFIQNLTIPVFLDEIQYAPELLASIKRYVDKVKKPGQFILSGSQNLSVLKDVSESLAGRAGIIHLYPFSQNELLGKAPEQSFLYKWIHSRKLPTTNNVTLPDQSIYSKIWKGGYPKLNDFDDELIPGFFQSYMQTYIERDVRKVADIGNLQTFGRFVGLLSSHTSQEINPNEFGRELGLDRKTIIKWKEIAEATFQWYTIPAFSRNPIKKLSSKEKGYFCDTGFIGYLQRLSSPETLRSHPFMGRLFETYVFMEILKNIQSWKIQPYMYHFRTYSGAEIDLILEMDGKLFPIEIKMTTKPAQKDLRGFDSFNICFPNENIQKGLVICSNEEPSKISEDIYSIPWWEI